MSRTTAAAAPVVDQPVIVEPKPPHRLQIDPERPGLATIDSRLVVRGQKKCFDCDRPIAVVREVVTARSHDIIDGRRPRAHQPGNFPGPRDRCDRCLFAELLGQDRWIFGVSTHDTLRDAIEATEDAVRPSELRLRADLQRQLDDLGPADDHRFKIGSVRIGEVTAKHGLYAEGVIRPLLARHATGDHGHFGKFPTGVSAEASWWPELASQEERNFIAVRDALGLVRSQFEVSHFDPHENRPVRSVARVATFIDGGKSSTLIVAEGRSQANV